MINFMVPIGNLTIHLQSLLSEKLFGNYSGA